MSVGVRSGRKPIKGQPPADSMPLTRPAVTELTTEGESTLLEQWAFGAVRFGAMGFQSNRTFFGLMGFQNNGPLEQYHSTNRAKGNKIDLLEPLNLIN